MSSTDGILLSRLPPSHSSITVGNGHTLPITCRGNSTLTTPTSSFQLNNILVVPSLIRNLIYVRQFTKDNNCTIEFDAFGFSVKDFLTRCEILRCNSTGDLYAIPPAASSAAPHAGLTISSSLWHLRLGHPGPVAITTLRQRASISCNKDKSRSMSFMSIRETCGYLSLIPALAVPLLLS